MKKIAVFDTTISDYNLGNQIIMESVYEHLYDLFPDDFFFKLPYMEITKHTEMYLKWSDLIFFGGTNSLTSRMEKYKQWGLSFNNASSVQNVILLGLGWWQYQEENISWYTRYLLKKCLSKKNIHAVRDNYTLEKLKSIGITNVLNTGCPTLWSLTKVHCQDIPHTKKENVVMTFTDYKKDPLHDLTLYNIIKANYQNVFIWIQGAGDYEYVLEELKIKNATIIPPNISAFNTFLEQNEVDYIGTRLHAGIRALQMKRRTCIIAVDNRAIEMGKDFGLPIVLRSDVSAYLEAFITSDAPTIIDLPEENIQKWKSQFFFDSMST